MSAKDKARDEVTDTINEVTDPSRMSRDDYIVFLEDIIDDLEMRLEAARADEKRAG